MTRRGVPRRALIGGGAAGSPAPARRVRPVAGGVGTARATDGTPATPRRAYPFHGEHQAGIVTPAQDRLHFAAFDVTTDSRAELVAAAEGLDRRAAERMTAGPAGRRVGAGRRRLRRPRPTTPARRSACRRAGSRSPSGSGRRCSATPTARTGSASPTGSPRRCAGCRTSPPTRSTRAQRRRPVRAGLRGRPPGGGARDPQPGPHRLRHRAVRWSQLGFGRTSSTSTSQSTPRNLFGFKDGTANLKAEETAGARRARVGRRRRRRPAPTGWPAARTSWRAGSTCTSRPGTARRCASRRR